MEDKRLELQRAIVALGPRGRGRPYPRDLLAKMIAYTAARREQGAKLLVIGDELGISWRSLSRYRVGSLNTRSRARAAARLAAARTRLERLGVIGADGRPVSSELPPASTALPSLDHVERALAQRPELALDAVERGVAG